MKIVVVDLGYGDAGKGSLTDYLVREHNADWVIRYNGGAQAAHNVVLDDGRHHTFSQFGSGTFATANTYLSKYVLINPLNLFAEADNLSRLGVRAFPYLYIHENALIITPFHVAINRLKEIARGINRHGSCGQGVGEAYEDRLAEAGDLIFARDFSEPQLLRVKLKAIQSRKRAWLNDNLEHLISHYEAKPLFDPIDVENCVFVYETISKLASIVPWTPPGYSETAIYEGAQGVLLDEDYGEQPHTTWGKTTTANAETMIADGEFQKIGVMRAYATRHGAGPFLTEDDDLSRLLPDRHNSYNPWQGTFRVGYTNLEETARAIEATGGVDNLAVTCLDRIDESQDWKVWSSEGRWIDCLFGDLCDLIEEELEVPIQIYSHGPTELDKKPAVAHELPRA